MKNAKMLVVVHTLGNLINEKISMNNALLTIYITDQLII